MKKYIVWFTVFISSVTNASGSGLLGGLMGGAVGTTAGKSAAQGANGSEIEKSLQKSVDGINARGPTMIDASTRMDGVTLGNGRVITYRHTMIKLMKQDVNMPYFHAQFTRDTRARVCGTQGMRQMLVNDVRFVYEYRAVDGQVIGAIPVDRKVCGL